MEDKINELLERVKNLEAILERIVDRTENIQISAQKMDTHINFVEDIYSVVKNPFGNLLHSYLGYNPTESICKIKSEKESEN